MNPERGIINANRLEELEYRRCTWWSSFLENIAEREDGEVYDVNAIVEEFDDDTSNDDAEEAEEVQVPEDIEYHNLMNQSTQQEKTTFIMESEEMQDILNSTRPILKEHELKLKATGLERIMNTFDSVRIEREVGGWMRRNHTTDSQQADVPSDSDSDSSSISCEDDHYIRSVQKCHNMRKPKHIQFFKKCKSAVNKYGRLVETKPHRSYTCNCCKYNSLRSPKLWKMPSTDEPEIIDKRHGTVPLFAENKHKMRHFIQECCSSSASDYDLQEKCCLKRNITPSTHTESKSDKRCFTTVRKRLLQNGSGNRMVSMMEKVYETPTKSTALKSSIPNTAPSKVSTKRGVARKALSLLNANKKANAKSTKSKRVDKTQESPTSSSECDTTFENAIQTAIALSLKSLKQNRKYDSSEQQPSTTSNSTNNSFQLAGSSRHSEVQEAVSPTKTRKKVDKSNTAKSKSVKKQSNLKKVNRKNNAAKENTFLNNLENICNSTAFNGAAACKQLPSCLPVIYENSVCSPTASPCTEIKQSTLRKKATSNLPALKESTTRGSEANSKMETQFKNVFSSTTIYDTAGSKKPPEKEPVTPCKPKTKIGGMRKAATEIRRKQRRNMVNNKTMSYRSSVSPTPASGAKSKSNRIMLYTPQRTARTLDGDFQVTKELMSSVIGAEQAHRFFKYHVGRLTFPKSSTVYYCPPEAELSSSDSDDDPLLKLGCYGELYESEKLDDSNVA